MLDEGEFAEVSRAYAAAFGPPTEHQHSDSTRPLGLAERFAGVLEVYERITGQKETVANAVMHHRISQYGEPCAACGRPLRTPQAKHCAACGFSVPKPPA